MRLYPTPWLRRLSIIRFYSLVIALPPIAGSLSVPNMPEKKRIPRGVSVGLAFSHICVGKEQAPTAKKDRRQGDNPNRRRIGL